MFLTHSMTTNNNKEPYAAALERQVQTLIAAVEHLTKQNHDLEEQLRRKDTRPNSHEEEQEGNNVERRDQEGSKGSKTPSRQEWQDTSRPSITETAPPHIVVEM